MRVKEIRNNKGLSQSYVANKLNISRSAYTNKENGKRQFSLNEILILEDILNSTFRELFGNLRE